MPGKHQSFVRKHPKLNAGHIEQRCPITEPRYCDIRGLRKPRAWRLAAGRRNGRRARDDSGQVLANSPALSTCNQALSMENFQALTRLREPSTTPGRVLVLYGLGVSYTESRHDQTNDLTSEPIPGPHPAKRGITLRRHGVEATDHCLVQWTKLYIA